MKINSRMSIAAGVLCLILGLAGSQLNAFPWQAARNVGAGVGAVGLTLAGLVSASAAEHGATVTNIITRDAVVPSPQHMVQALLLIEEHGRGKAMAVTGATTIIAAALAAGSFYGAYRCGKYLYDQRQSFYDMCTSLYNRLKGGNNNPNA